MLIYLDWRTQRGGSRTHQRFGPRKWRRGAQNEAQENQCNSRPQTCPPRGEAVGAQSDFEGARGAP